MKYRVCHISESTSGGVYTHLIQLAKHLNQEMFDQTYILSSIKNESLKEQKSFFGHSLIIADMKREISLLGDLKSLLQITRYLRANKFDVIHCHSSKAGVIGRIAAFLTGHPTVFYTPHSFSFHAFNSKLKNAFFMGIERCMASFTTRLICVSLGEARLAVNSKVVPSSKIRVILNGVDQDPVYKEGILTETYRPQAVDNAPRLISFIGRLSKQKNPHMAVEAMKYVTTPNTQLILMGGGPLEKELKAFADTIGVSNKVRFMGDVSQVRPLLRECELFVSTSLWESMPYAILEAMAESVPIIATEIDGVTDLIKHNETGALVSPFDSQGLGKLIDEFLRDKQKSRQLALRAQEWIRKNHTIEGMITKLEKLYLSPQGDEDVYA
ncbi:glycosyltransferase involved in cell wall biosynthesis [Paenibacillus mucilaginosus]|uniref:glycosyltransferase family 4 protein n=1 Tax=Paenibacillus mucilaginosus TaxID=61624 RepID=UPI003D1CE4A9